MKHFIENDYFVRVVLRFVGLGKRAYNTVESKYLFLIFCRFVGYCEGAYDK